MLIDRPGGPSSLLLGPILGRETVRDNAGAPVPQAFDEAFRSVSIEVQSTNGERLKPCLLRGPLGAKSPDSQAADEARRSE